ncbi:reverse transcriptase domain-containing protein [Tanacetum coccineum]
MATCHHLSGDTWHDNCSDSVTRATVRAIDQRWSTTVNGGGQWCPTTVNGGEPPPDHRSTTGQRQIQENKKRRDEHAEIISSTNNPMSGSSGSISKKKKYNYSSFQDLRSSSNEDMMNQFLEKAFLSFKILNALISDRGTHFCNRQMEKILKKYGVHHRIAITYHPQTSVQVENTNRALKRILKKIVKDNLSIWSRKLDDALWAFRTAYKTPIGTTPYRLLYGKMCHLLFEIEHRAYWALRSCNPDLKVAGEKQFLQLHELDN